MSSVLRSSRPSSPYSPPLCSRRPRHSRRPLLRLPRQSLHRRSNRPLMPSQVPQESQPRRSPHPPCCRRSKRPKHRHQLSRALTAHPDPCGLLNHHCGRWHVAHVSRQCESPPFCSLRGAADVQATRDRWLLHVCLLVLCLSIFLRSRGVSSSKVLAGSIFQGDQCHMPSNLLWRWFPRIVVPRNLA